MWELEWSKYFKIEKNRSPPFFLSSIQYIVELDTFSYKSRIITAVPLTQRVIIFVDASMYYHARY